MHETAFNLIITLLPDTRGNTVRVAKYRRRQADGGEIRNFTGNSMKLSSRRETNETRVPFLPANYWYIGRREIIEGNFFNFCQCQLLDDQPIDNHRVSNWLRISFISDHLRGVLIRFECDEFIFLYRIRFIPPFTYIAKVRFSIKLTSFLVVRN